MAEFSKETINIGTTSNDGTGDTIRVAFRKTNNNFTELYDHSANLSANVETLQTDLEQYAGDLLILGGAAFDQANLAYDSSNNLILISQTAIRFANNAANTANAAGIIANSAYNFANGSFLNSANAHTKANAAFVVANAAFNLANTIADLNAEALAQAAKLNRAYTKANDAYDLAFATYLYSFGVAANAEAAFARTNNVYGYLNTAISRINAVYTVVNSAYITINAGYVVANSSYMTGNGAFRVANASFAVANAAFPNTDGAVFNGRLFTANTLFGGTLLLSANGVYGTSNNWYGVYARSSNNHALKAESTGNNDAIFTLAQRGNGVFGTANTGNGVVGFSDKGYGGYFYSANGIPFGSGYLKAADDDTLQIVDAMIVDANGIVKFDSGYGYPSPVYGCRAWVNFDGLSTSASLTGLSFTANATTNILRINVTDPANNDLEIDSTIYVLGTSNGTRRRHSDGATLVFASWLALGCRRDSIARTYKITNVNQSSGWVECEYPDRFDYPGYFGWFFWWWWWYYIYGWRVPNGFSFSGTCNILRSQIRGAGGISSVEDLGDGQYQINFDFEMPDTNYAVTGTVSSPEFFRIQSPYRRIGWASGTSLTIRTLHTKFCEVSSTWHWGGPTYWWWYWWWGYFLFSWNGPGTYPARHIHVAIFR